MTDSFVTQCPHCQTSFRVNHAQLSVARGVVRCGSCLQVFNAAKQLLEQAGKEVSTPVAPGNVEATEPRAISQKQWSATELDLDALDLDEELARLEQRESRPTTGFVRQRDDSLSARRSNNEHEEEPWSDSLFSESAADRAEVADVGETAPPLIETGVLSRTEPSLSLVPVELDDEPQPPQLRLDDPLDAPPHHERLSATSARDDFDDDLSSVAPLRKRHERNESTERVEALQDL
ncbi:MJ0042-type zinc finger domain-containing protein, partial [Pseudomonas fluorescens]